MNQRGNVIYIITMHSLYFMLDYITYILRDNYIDMMLYFV